MSRGNRTFIFGAGFSKPAGMPLATELLSCILGKLDIEKPKWLDSLASSLAWLDMHTGKTDSYQMNIEQVFHHAHFLIESYRLRQHLVTVGRSDGETPWSFAEEVEADLSFLEEGLRDVIFSKDRNANLEPVVRWAKHVRESDSILTFNYDSLVERGLSKTKKAWTHGFDSDVAAAIPVFKLHGSIDWIVAHRSEEFKSLELLFDKSNSNQRDGRTGSIEDDNRLWCASTRRQLDTWIKNRDLQLIPKGAVARTVGIAGLGSYKPLHLIPGLGYVWTAAMSAVYRASCVVFVGFSMSDFDTMAQVQFAEVARTRMKEGRPLKVIVIDPFVDNAIKKRFGRVFRNVTFEKSAHEKFDWASLDMAARKKKPAAVGRKRA